MDLRVANPFAAARANVIHLAGSPAFAAASAYDRKVRGWQGLLEASGVAPGLTSSKFAPLAVTAIGAWDERSLLWLKRFSAVCAAASGEDTGSALVSLMTRLSVALWRGNSHMIRALRPPPTLPGDERDDLRRLGSGHFSDDDMDFSSENPEVERPDQHDER